MSKAIACACYRVPPCPGCQALPGEQCITRRGLEYPYSHLSRRHIAARIAGLVPREHSRLLCANEQVTKEQHEFIVSEISRTGNKSGITTLRILGRIARGEAL